MWGKIFKSPELTSTPLLLLTVLHQDLMATDHTNNTYGGLWIITIAIRVFRSSSLVISQMYFNYAKLLNNMQDVKLKGNSRSRGNLKEYSHESLSVMFA